MGVKKAGREELSESAQKWLPGEPSGFFKFKTADELASMWAEYRDPEVTRLPKPADVGVKDCSPEMWCV
jgi:hypothetical protein